MGDLMEQLFLGFQVALTLQNILYCFIGVLLGTLVGILPGIGPAASIAILLPTTFVLNSTSAIIMLAGIYYGAMYGGSITSILVNVPGEAASVVTCLDGYQMARQGRAGVALGISAIGSFIAGTIGVVILSFLAPPLASLALTFGPADYFALMVLGVSMVLYLSGGSRLKAGIMATLGFFTGLIGLDPETGVQRFTFGTKTLLDGLGFVPVAMGLFGISEVLENAGKTETQQVFTSRIGRLLPSLQDWAETRWAILRGSVVGFFVGLLPGGGAVVSSFLSYALERRLARDPKRFGQGAIQGVAAPESANNAAATGAFIPMLVMGIPSNAVTALMLAALLIHGITPGPLLMNQHPELFWGVIASMYIGNIILLILNLPLVGLFVQILKIQYRLLAPLIVLFCLVGAYSLNNNICDVLIMFAAGLVGFILRSFRFDPAPLILTMVIAPMMEMSFRQGLLVARGNIWEFFVGRSTTAFLWLAICVLIFSPLAYRFHSSIKIRR